MGQTKKYERVKRNQNFKKLKIKHYPSVVSAVVADLAALTQATKALEALVKITINCLKHFSSFLMTSRRWFWYRDWMALIMYSEGKLKLMGGSIEISDFISEVEL